MGAVGRWRCRRRRSRRTWSSIGSRKCANAFRFRGVRPLCLHHPPQLEDYDWSGQRLLSLRSPPSAFGIFPRETGEAVQPLCAALLLLICCALDLGSRSEAAAGGWITPKGRAHGCARVFRQHRDVLSENPGPTSRPGGQDARRARRRGGLLFGYFLLATQEKVTRPAEPDDKSHGWRAPYLDTPRMAHMRSHGQMIRRSNDRRRIDHRMTANVEVVRLQG